MSPEEIARKLTAAQRRALLRHYAARYQGWPQSSRDPLSSCQAGRSLMDMRLIEWHPDKRVSLTRITKLGLAVQAFARHRIQALEEAAKIMRDAIASGYAAPPNKSSQCAHGKFWWEDCISCYDDALDAAVSRFLHPADGVNDPAANGD